MLRQIRLESLCLHQSHRLSIGHLNQSSWALSAFMLLCTLNLQADDWARFRGPNGTGMSTAAPSLEWSETENIKWRIDLPGPGSSSPIVVGDKVFVTCWTGYAESKAGDPGDPENLKRVLLCVNRKDGTTFWSKSVDAKLPEDQYTGMFTQHGYASHTPTSDGESVYAYFGKTGVVAFDLEGNELWRADCGDGFGAKDWGSAASPLLYENLLLVSAFAESNALIAFDKTNGKEVWRFEQEDFNGIWSTPALATSAEGRTDLVVVAPFKVFGLDPATGKELWSSVGLDNDTVSASPLIDGDVAYVMAGRGGSIAIRVGGQGDVTDTHVIWKGSQRGGIPTPVAYEGRIYGLGRSGISCFDAETGETIYQSRFVSEEVAEAAEAAPPVNETPANQAGRPDGGSDGERPERGRRGAGRSGARFRNMPYASPVIAGDKFITINRSGEAFVCQLGGEFEQLENNVLDDGGDFSSTPSLAGNEIFIRSSKSLYCIGK